MSALSRLVVAQPKTDSPLPVGVVRWRHAGPMLTVVVKSTLSFAGGGERVEATEAREQAALSADVPGEGGLLYYASDFVPRKAKADLLFVGHARAPGDAAARVDVQLSAGGAARSVVVIASPLGPVGATPAPLAAHPRSFDFARYNRAAPEQRVARVETPISVELVGASAAHRRRVIDILAGAPRAVVDAGGASTAIELVCDTLWIDVDREACVLVWRGATEIDADRVDLVIVTRGDWTRSDLQRGTFAHAAEEGDVTADPADLALARYSTWEVTPPEPELSLERYAAVSADLAEQREPRADVLRRHRLDEDGWLVEERAWLERIAAAAMRGDASSSVELGEHFIAAQERLARPEEARRSIDDYIAVRAAVEAAEDPSTALAAFSITLPEYMRLERRWGREAERDPALAEAIERRVAARVAEIEAAEAEERS